MQLATVSLDESQDDAMNLHATQDEPETAQRPTGIKFTYASGSRPLEGYTIKRGIGRGGFGEVYYAASDAGKEVAIKLIRRNLDVELRGVTQCLNLKHPNLLSLFDVKQDELGDSWVVMEFVAGESLEDVLERCPDGLPHNEVLAWFHGIAAGVTYLHDHGIVHRDLKPGNIFGDEGIVKIGDYGLSKFISASRRSGQTESVGTVHYMAPEIGNGRYGKEIDIYALGIILYEMLTGRVPFEGESVGEVLMKHLTAEPNLEGIEEPYRSAIAKTLTKNPDTRIKTVGELLALLPPPPPGTFIGANSRRVAAEPAIEPPPAPRPQQPQGSPVTAILVAEEEPIAQAVRKVLGRFSTAWNSGRINTPGKVAIILVTAYMLVIKGLALALIPMTMSALILYAFYYAIRSVVIATRTPPPPGRPNVGQRPSPRPPGAPLTPVVEQRAPAPYEHTAAANRYAADLKGQIERQAAAVRIERRAVERTISLPPKTVRQRVEELMGSLLGATLVTAAMSVFLSVVHSKTFEPGQFAWLLLVSTLGSWMVLIPSKFWEGHDGDTTLRRLTLAVLGLGLGAAAWTIKDFLLVPLTSDWHLGRAVTEGYFGTRLHDAVDGSPTLVAHIGYFAFLLLLVRWWKQADPLRPSRLRLWPTIVVIFWGWLLYFFWPFPQPWGTMVAASMAIAVQVSASWERGKRRVAA